MTIEESILAYVLTLLNNVTGAKAYRSRETPTDRLEGVVIKLQPEESTDEQRTKGGIDLQLIDFTFLVTIIGRGPVPDSGIDPQRQQMHKLVMADRTLGGRCSQLSLHTTKWDFEQADGTAVACEMRYTARLQTPAGDIGVST